jgi:hypothetical protein
MTNTFSMNESVPDAPVLNADEQESLALGEQMEADHAQLLAGKYNSVQDLEKGYLEAQKMLSDRQVEEENNDGVEPEESSNTDFLNAAAAEFGQNGELSEETMNSLVEMSSEDLIAAYIESQANQQPVGVELNEKQVRSIYNSVGGEEQYDALVGWASENLADESIAGFDALIESGNEAAIQLAVAGLNAMYEAQNGSDGQMITGKAPTSSGDRFRSQQEVVAAMSDPRYDNDPAYRQEIIQKLDRSDNFF